MFRFLMGFLRCPEGGKLLLVPFVEAHNKYRNEKEVIEGVLVSKKTGNVFPIWNGIPRMLPDSIQSNMAFYEKYRPELSKYDIRFDSAEIRRFRRLNRQVKRTFEFAWKIWGKSERIYGMSQDEYKKHVFAKQSSRKLNDAYFKGKVVFEGGCGHGLMSQVMSPLCREYIGLDLGNGIDVARHRSQRLHNVHLIQGDILSIPVKPNAFDYVYSYGVIHHTPDTHRALSLIHI